MNMLTAQEILKYALILNAQLKDKDFRHRVEVEFRDGSKINIEHAKVEKVADRGFFVIYWYLQNPLVFQADHIKLKIYDKFR